MLAELDLMPATPPSGHGCSRRSASGCSSWNDVGLHYLSLDRPAATLAGGEAQRIRLATRSVSGLVGVLYVSTSRALGCTSATIGAHRDLVRLRDLGNTLIVVEHDEDTIRAADWVVDIGPGAGEHGGEVVVSGPVAELVASPSRSRAVRGGPAAHRGALGAPAAA